MNPATLLPIYFEERNERERKEFGDQMMNLLGRYGGEAQFLEPVTPGARAPGPADAVVIPQLFGAVFSHGEDLKRMGLPVLVLTSREGTVEMWDWEIVAYLREEVGLTVYAPYSDEMARCILRAFAARRELRAGGKFLLLQDSPGEGMQSEIFKRFYWWERSCTRKIEETFGVELIYRSWKEVNDRAACFRDDEALRLWEERRVPCEGVPRQGILRAVKLYLALRETSQEIGGLLGIGSNCLNESFHSATTPCLAWNWLFEYDHLLWACEGDTVTLISMFILYSSLRAPLMMTNLYPFLVGMTALRHEKIDRFPDIPNPANHALGVHCGYFGFAPQSFCASWVMRPKVLEIVNPNAVVIDCRFDPGPVTMAKLHADMNKLTIIEAEIEDYVQYPGSDCRNGALLHYIHDDGFRVMERLSSHHGIIIKGNVTPLLLQMAQVYGFESEVL